MSNTLLILVSFFYHSTLIRGEKTPLRYTPKLIRIYIISIIILYLVSFLYFAIPISNLIIILVPALSDFVNVYDKIKNKKFIFSAIKKLNSSKVKIIAITGSNGKTSVKNILYKILAEKYNCQMTPKSYNTPLGICKFINEELKHDTDYLILEYGARNRGDIKKLCKYFGADYGIVTTLAPQHMESFKSIENIYKTKKELPDFLFTRPCVYNIDNVYTLRMYNEKNGVKYSTSVINKTADIYASNVEIRDYKTQFMLSFKDKKIDITTSLLGMHNVSNILLASALALNLGISMEEIKTAVVSLEFVPHRLELIQSRLNILDDSYNCSILSATESINVAKQFPNKKMVVTPGIIEGGKIENELNFKLGELLSDLDYIVIVGEHNKSSLLSGLRAKNFNEANLYFAKTLEEAKTFFSKLCDADTLLLLNDLPDDYS